MAWNAWKIVSVDNKVQLLQRNVLIAFFILFLYTSSLISKKYRGDTVKSKQDVLIYNSTCM